MKRLTFFALIILLSYSMGNGSELSVDDIIQKMLVNDSIQKNYIKDLTFDTELIEGEKDDGGNFKEKERFKKKIYLKYLEDTTLIHEQYLEYYKNNELQDKSKMLAEAKDRLEKKRKRKARDISHSMFTPFYSDKRDNYSFEFLGLSNELVEGYNCYVLKVSALEERDGLINGKYFIDTISFNIIKIDFSPAALVKKTMFKMHKLDMTILYTKTEEGYFVPKQFIIDGKGRAAFFFGVKFFVTEYYRNPVFNSGIEDKIFEVQNGN